MGWLGTLFVGAIVGFAGGAMQGRRRLKRLALIALIAAVCALLAKMVGNIVGLFDDGSSVEWLTSVVAAIVAASVTGMVVRT